jgi:outer membrane lipoprotein SlyB
MKNMVKLTLFLAAITLFEVQAFHPAIRMVTKIAGAGIGGYVGAIAGYATLAHYFDRSMAPGNRDFSMAVTHNIISMASGAPVGGLAGAMLGYKGASMALNKFAASPAVKQAVVEKIKRLVRIAQRTKKQ